MSRIQRIIMLLLAGVAVPGLLFAQAGTTTRVTQGSGQSMTDVQAQHYNGPRARIAVARFENKTANASRWYSAAIGDGMADMLTTSLVNTGRYIVLERDSLDTVLDEQDLGASGRIRQDTAAAIGEIEGAELLIVAAVTEFEDNSGGTQAGGGGRANRIFGAITGGSRSAHMAVDLRVVDATTSRILAATSVEGEAKDFNIGGALAGYTGSVGLGGGISHWKNTPREKALRQVIGTAVDYIISVTPAEMMRYNAFGQPVDSGAAGAAPVAAAAADEGNLEQVVITATGVSAHQGPNESTPALHALEPGHIAAVLLRAGEWIQVRDDQGRTGWVHTEHTLAVQ